MANKPAFVCEGEGCSEVDLKLTTLSRYLQLDTWTPVDAALLVSGLQPLDDCNEIPKTAMGLDNSFYSGNEDAFHFARRTLKIWDSQVSPPEKITPSEFVAWCKTKGIDTTWLNDVPAKVEAAPAAKVEAVTVTRPSGEDIPGKMPRTAIGKQAIKAAWQIECETSKLATPRQVIDRLQALVETEPELVAVLPHGITWTTSKGAEKAYEVEACAKTLGKWNTSRP
jgi:hypothetical protein